MVAQATKNKTRTQTQAHFPLEIGRDEAAVEGDERAAGHRRDELVVARELVDDAVRVVRELRHRYAHFAAAPAVRVVRQDGGESAEERVEHCEARVQRPERVAACLFREVQSCEATDFCTASEEKKLVLQEQICNVGT